MPADVERLRRAGFDDSQIFALTVRSIVG